MEKEKFLRIEINEMLNIFDFYQISEERQKRIILEGVNFQFWDNNKKKQFNIIFDCFKFAQLLRAFKMFEVDLDIDRLLGDKPGFPQYPYQELILSFCEFEEISKKRERK